MKSRLLPLLAILLIVTACGPAAEPAPEPAAEPEPAPMDDAVAVDAVRAAYMEHYNAGDAAGVAALFAEDGVFVGADGSVQMARAAIQANLEEQMPGSPMADISTADTKVFGDQAVTRGAYSVQMTPAEGADPIGFAGSYMTVFRRVDGDWKIAALVTNYDAPPAEGLPMAGPSGDDPEEMTDTPISGLLASYVEHYNQGHADVVAGLYAEDAVAAFSDVPASEGRAAIEAYLTASIAAMDSPQLSIHQAGAFDLGDGWYVGGGWYEITAGDDGRMGYWMTLSHTDAEGSQTTHWGITNSVRGEM